MIYALKLLLFVLVAGSAAAFVLRPAFASLFAPAQYKRACMSMFVVTVIAFLSMRPELFILFIAIAGFFISRQLGQGDLGKVNTFLLLLLPLPPISYTVGGLEGLNYIMRLDHNRVMSLVLLTVPAVRLLLRQRKRDEPSLRVVDVAVFLVQFWDIILQARYASLTGLFRTLVESFCDILIPYYVITRTLRTPAQFREAASYLLLGCVFVASIACAESLIQRNLYGGLQWIYGVRWESTVDLRRGGFLRVEATTPQPIVLAFVLLFGAGLWSWLKGAAPRDKRTYLVYLIFAVALVSTWSRGPWLGASLMGVAFLLQRWLAPRVFGAVVILCLVAAVGLKMIGADGVVMSGLATIFGSSDSEMSTIAYRRDLLDASVAMIKQSPWMGVPNWESGLSAFRQGEGLIDLVNSYIVIMINSGVIGLTLFLFPYAYLVNRMLHVQGKERMASKAVLGKFAPAFIVMILGMLFTIFTASTLDVMRYLLGLAIALPAVWLMQAKYAVVARDETQPEAEMSSGGIVAGYLRHPGLPGR